MERSVQKNHAKTAATRTSTQHRIYILGSVSIIIIRIIIIITITIKVDIVITVLSSVSSFLYCIFIWALPVRWTPGHSGVVQACDRQAHTHTCHRGELEQPRTAATGAAGTHVTESCQKARSHFTVNRIIHRCCFAVYTLQYFEIFRSRSFLNTHTHTGLERVGAAHWHCALKDRGEARENQGIVQIIKKK